MPTFTAVALERLLEPRESKSASDSKLERCSSTPVRANGTNGDDFKPVSVPRRKPSIPFPPPVHPSGLKRNSSSSRTPEEKEKSPWPKISPALYSTPASTPLPDSPTLHSQSPYLINHKRRGPRLQKSFSDDNVLKATVDEKVTYSRDSSYAEIETNPSSSVNEDIVPSVLVNPLEEKEANGVHQEKIEYVALSNVKTRYLPSTSSVEKESESDDFYDPQESMSVTSNTDGEDFGADLSPRTLGGVFYDAWDELSSDSGRQMNSLHDLETELREMRLSLLMEVEKRKQAEEILYSMQTHWQRLCETLRKVGLVLPTDLCTIFQDTSMTLDFAFEIFQQIKVTRFVSESVGEGVARAECEEEMQAQLETKNFEIARLCDRLNYYETMNREMSQRNQEAIELARRDRQRRNKLQKWVWGSIATAVTLGTVALAWSYMPSTEASPSHQPQPSELDTSTE